MGTEEDEFKALEEKIGAETIDCTKQVTNIKIVLIGHKKRQGKDTFADNLSIHLESLGISTSKISFADSFKKILAEALDISLEKLDYLKNNNDYYRGMLQRFGSGLMKKYFGDAVWRDIALKEIKELEKDGVNCVIISDFRFPCEYIRCSTTINVIRDIRDDKNEHISETALDGYGYDKTIINVGTLEELYDEARIIANSMSDHNV